MSALAAGALAGCAWGTSGPVPTGSDTQLFVDGRMVSGPHGVRPALHPGRKVRKPVIVADQPCEGERICVNETVGHDPARIEFRKWCLARLGPGHESRLPGLGRVTWRLDGIVSVDSSPDGGAVETVPLEPAVDRLEIDDDALRGSLRLKALSLAGEVLTGFGLGLSEPIHGNHGRPAVRWIGRDRFDTRDPIRLRFHLNDSRLYSYRIQTDNEPTQAGQQIKGIRSQVPFVRIPARS